MIFIKTFGIISEYNPFHKGHAYHIDTTRKEFGAERIVCAMSGNCVQRGDFAIFDKWSRAKEAVMGGADLVVELPSSKSIASAQRFAENGVYLLGSLGVDAISFGSECGDVKTLQKVAELSERESFSKTLKELLKTGLSYPNAYTQALVSHGAEESVLQGANNLLGIEYIKAIKKFGFSIEPVTVKRVGATHNETERDGFVSSTFLREELLKESTENTHSLLQNEGAVLALLRTSKMDFSTLPDCSEGIENRLKKAIEISTSLTELYENIKTKRYPLSRVRRLVLCALLELTEKQAISTQKYARMLACNCKGIELSERYKESSQIRIITRLLDDFPGGENLPQELRFECKVLSLYEIFGKSTGKCGTEISHTPFFLK